jgi:general secretion pathway protein C
MTYVEERPRRVIVMKHIIIIITMILSISCTATPAAARHGGNPDALRDASVSNLKLKGTFFTESLNPLAVIEHSDNGQIMMYELGDDIAGLRIVSISRGEIKLRLDGREYVLSFSYGGMRHTEKPYDETDKWYNVSRQGNVVTIDKATVTGAILRARDIMQDLKTRPYSQDGKRAGIAITSLNEIGILEEIGIKEGDIIKKVNGFTLNSPYQVFNAYRNLRNKQELKVDITRQGSALTLTYRIIK